eukprot:6197657-Pleurochrysis_carterae.AAC.5
MNKAAAISAQPTLRVCVAVAFCPSRRQPAGSACCCCCSDFAARSGAAARASDHLGMHAAPVAAQGTREPVDPINGNGNGNNSFNDEDDPIIGIKTAAIIRGHNV